MTAGNVFYRKWYPLAVAVLVFWAGLAQGAADGCAKGTGLSTETTLQDRSLPALLAPKGVEDKEKKGVTGGSSGVLRMLIPNALRHGESS